MLSTVQFEEYLTPCPDITFSHQYFALLTFERASDVKFSYPKILPKGSVKEWAFDDVVYQTIEATTICSHELIPHYDDIRGIIEKMSQAYATSSRSVRLSLLNSGSQNCRVVYYHFSKASLFIVIVLETY